ncbi:FAS1 domain-containing protein [Thozetella sp. PMI_491]|nr:FAS1 domain-containing protein [Thozetella sp. PMI_491]
MASTVLGQSQADLSSAISQYPELSSFASLLNSNPGIISSVIPMATKNVTVLVPSNDAFAKYANTTGSNVTTLGASDLVLILQYHVMAANMTTQDFNADQGIVVPTLLKDQAHNNRTAGAALKNQYGDDAAQGQLIFAQKASSAPSKSRVKKAIVSPQRAPLSGGKAQGAVMLLVDGQWSGGSFQIIDTLLIPPTACSQTVRSDANLSSLDNALNRTSLWSTVDHLSNITCLGPSANAFKNAGNADSNLSPAQLSEALLNHTIATPLYSPYLIDGMVIPSMGKMNITVTIQGDDIWFNDAKVIQPNVLTNNGLIHVLDKVMTDQAIPNVSRPSSQPTSTVTQTSKPSSTSNAAPTAVGNAEGGIVALVAAVAMLL